jgi:putative serine protease PepD
VTSPARDAIECKSCGASVSDRETFCTHCGVRLERPQQLVPVNPDPSANDKESVWRIVTPAAIAFFVVLALVLAVVSLSRVRTEREALLAEHTELVNLKARTQRMARDVEALQTQIQAVKGEADATSKASKEGIAPLASRILRSVYTIDTPYGSGTGWAAWKAAGATYLITANHVTEGVRSVKVRQKTSTWTGRVVKSDDVNDFAVIRVNRELGPSLWQAAKQIPRPAVGDTLMLLGSPYGLEGTVTTGVVSRVTYNRIQTDAAANPGNSGGPAVDAQGHVVGILVSGGGENINFAIPLSRACVAVRKC